MSNVQNSQQAGVSEPKPSAGRVPSEELKAALIAAIESGEIIGALFGNQQSDVRLLTKAGQWPVFGENVVVLVLGQPLDTSPSVRWIAAD